MNSFKEFFKPEIIWFLVGIGMLLLEFGLPGFVIVFFGLGAFVVAIVCAVTTISLNAQLILFLVASVLLLVGLRRWLKGIFLGYTSSSGGMSEREREFIGQRARVIRRITPQETGRVEFRGTEWDAQADETIPEGAVVEIRGQENITLKVKPYIYSTPLKGA